MPDRHTNDINVTLKSLEELFTSPEPDFWSPTARYRSGIDEIWAKLRLEPAARPAHIVFHLPQEITAPDLAERMTAALGRYADVRAAANEEEIAAVKREGRRNFLISLVVVIGLFLALFVLNALLKPTDAILAVIVAWTGIAVWAILWNPVDTYVWGWRPNRHEVRLCDKLRAAQVEIVPDNSGRT